ncbi:DUF5694 domain-containing protein [Riemerella anatipestifer]|uniref:DUF5694 domain-containing protein n=1 Tax=Riemerella anatipestifer TaxID=34085 RepID=UPI00129D9C1C|nr:DUF5694 domain-containing protein [Riemerella anatipestifer]MRM83108.1 hypothetical protein [Riemerella anatipestifer]
MKNRILIALLFISTLTFGQEKNKILTLGTFHFHLVKSQFGVDFDINNKDKQKELTEIIKQIETYKPTKIFVEWEFSKQGELDELYNLYLKDKTFELIKQKYGKNETMYFESEVQQLGFKLADKLKHKKLYAFDYLINEPNDTVMIAIQKANQTDLMNEIQREFGEYGQAIVTKFQQEKSIKNLLLFFNNKELEDKLNSGYISLFNKAGSKDDFSGAYFVSERFKRNLYMYSLIQKQIDKTDERILVIVGGQHSAGFRDFIRDDKNLEKVELETILK